MEGLDGGSGGWGGLGDPGWGIGGAVEVVAGVVAGVGGGVAVPEAEAVGGVGGGSWGEAGDGGCSGDRPAGGDELGAGDERGDELREADFAGEHEDVACATDLYQRCFACGEGAGVHAEHFIEPGVAAMGEGGVVAGGGVEEEDAVVSGEGGRWEQFAEGVVQADGDVRIDESGVGLRGVGEDDGVAGAGGGVDVEALTGERAIESFEVE